MKIKWGKALGQFVFIPEIGVYIHGHLYDPNFFTENKNKYYPWHFHFSIQWLFWFMEIQIGKDYIDE